MHQPPQPASRSLALRSSIALLAACASFLASAQTPSPTERGSFEEGSRLGAVQWGVTLHGMSHHFTERHASSGESWNEANSGLGIRAQWSDQWAAQAGFYDNSVNRESVYAIVDWTPARMGPVRLGVFAGAVTGYDFKNSSSHAVQPGGGALARLDLPWAASSLGVRMFPKVKQTGTALVAAEVNVGF